MIEQAKKPNIGKISDQLASPPKSFSATGPDGGTRERPLKREQEFRSSSAKFAGDCSGNTRRGQNMHGKWQEDNYRGGNSIGLWKYEGAAWCRHMERFRLHRPQTPPPPARKCPERPNSLALPGVSRRRWGQCVVIYNDSRVPIGRVRSGL